MIQEACSLAMGPVAFHPQEGRYKTLTSQNKKLPKATGPSGAIPTTRFPLFFHAYDPQAREKMETLAEAVLHLNILRFVFQKRV